MSENIVETTKKDRLGGRLFKIEKPNLTNIDTSKIIQKLTDSDKSGGEDFWGFYERVNEPNYLYWDRIKYKQPPQGFSPEEFWFLTRLLRTSTAQKTPIRTEGGAPFKWVRLPSTEEFLHKIDVNTGGQIFAPKEALSASNKQRYISRGIIEEAIASSQLEGAHTTRRVAKKMLAEKRAPRNKSEQMILNNYKTILALEDDYKNKELSKDMLLELHSMLTDETIDPSEQHRFRKDSDNIVVNGQIGSEFYITHIPPKERFVAEEIENLIKYANDENGGKFLHPIVKAIFIHFWIGYLHPFTDGNGRLARALFYWYLLRKGYWTFMYLPISTIIKRAPIQYAMAYIYSEQDSQDITYFYDFHISKIMLAMRDFNNYVTNKVGENKLIDNLLKERLALNDRQKQLIHHLISEEGASVTITSHATLNNISRQTAARDIGELTEASLIQGFREGKYIRYQPTEKLRNLALEQH